MDTERDQTNPDIHPNELQFITTKLTIPPSYLKRTIPRPHIHALLEMSRVRALTLVTAPAGFGKTTAVSEWLRQQGYPAAWISFEKKDNDPQRFWRYIIEAIHHAYPAGELNLTIPSSIAGRQGELFLTTLINMLVRIPEEIVLVLDDYATITAESIQQEMAFLLDHLPPQLHLILITRNEPQLPLARLRVQGKLVEIRVPQLRFTAAETATFLTQGMELPLSDSEIALLARRTEGWIAGLQLAALAIQHHLAHLDRDARPSGQTGILDECATRQALIAASTHNNKYIMNYLTDEVLSQQPQEVQRFLLTTSILDRFTASLCDAVTEQDNSEAIIEYLESNNLFITELDQQPHWYRYDTLLAELLRYQLRQSAGMQEIEAVFNPRSQLLTQPRIAAVRFSSEYSTKLHLRASHWYDQRGMVSEAIQHLLAARTYGEATNIIEQHSWSYIQQGKIRLVYTWMKALPPQSFVSHPQLTFFYAYTLFYQAQIVESERQLSLAEQRAQNVDSSSLSGHIYGLQAQLAHIHGDGQRTRELAQRALDHASNDSWLQSNALITLASSYLIDGDLLEATTLINDSFLVKQKSSLVPLQQRINHYQGLLAFRLGNLSTAYQIFQHLLDAADNDNAWRKAGVNVHLAELYYEWNDITAAQEHLQKAQRISAQEASTMPSSPQSFIVAARIARVQESKEEAFRMLDLAEQSIQRIGGNTLLLAYITELRVQYLLQDRGGTEAEQWYQRYAPTDASELNKRSSVERMYWTRTQIRLLLDAGRSAEALALLQPLLQAAEQQGRKTDMLSLLILQTLVYYAEGNTHATLQTLGKALKQAEPGGYIRSFIDEGAAMIALLSELYARNQRRPSLEQMHTVTLLERAQKVAGEPETTRSERAVPITKPLEAIRPGKRSTTWNSDLPFGYVYMLLHSFGTRMQPPLWLVSQESDEALIDRLSEREYRVLSLIAEGLSNQEIAQKLVVTVSTIKTHLNNIYAKLHVHTRLQAVTKAYSLGLLRRSDTDMQ